MMNRLRFVAGVLLTACLLGIATINLESTPPIWWDEGWNLSVARNWVEKGQYGRLLEGKAIAAGLVTGFPAVAPVAISFQLLGVGIWQGRVVGLIFTLGAFIVIYFLAQRLYNKDIAIPTIAILLFMSPKQDLNALLIGRQVLGEMPMLFYLLSGYCFLLLALQSSTWLILVVIPLWALALTTKLQLIPFWFLSLLSSLYIAVYYKHWRIAGLLFGAVTGSILVAAALRWGLPIILLNPDLPWTTVSGLYNVTALADLPLDRRIDVLVGLIYVLPTVLGLCYATRQLEFGNPLNPLHIVRLSVWILCASWFGWYFLFSVGWDRYLFPPLFIGSIFAAVLLHDLSNQFNWSSTVKHAARTLRSLDFDRESSRALLAIGLVTFQFALTAKTFYHSYLVKADQSVVEVANFLNTQTAPDALIETYDSELFFLLNRRYHYPPDQIHIDISRGLFLVQNVQIRYDPLSADPDYLIIGPFSKLWRLYDAVVDRGEFLLLKVYGRYLIYQRVR